MVGSNINGGAKSTGAIAAGTHTTLHLYAAGAGRDIWQVNKKTTLAFCIIVGYAIERNVNAGSIRAPYAYARVTHAIARIRVNYRGGDLV